MALPTELPNDVESLKTFCKWFADNNNLILNGKDDKKQFAMVNIEQNMLGKVEIGEFNNLIKTKYTDKRGLVLVQYPDTDEIKLGGTNDKYGFNFTVWFLKKPAKLKDFDELAIAMQYAFKCYLQFRGYLKKVLNSEKNKARFRIDTEKTNTDPVTNITDQLCGYSVNIRLEALNMACFENTDYKTGSI